MIAEESIANVSARLNVFFASAREQAKDGLTWQEFGRLLVQLLWMSVEGLDAVASLTGPQKREVAVTAAAVLFDTLADKAVPVAAWPAWMLLRPQTSEGACEWIWLQRKGHVKIWYPLRRVLIFDAVSDHDLSVEIVGK